MPDKVRRGGTEEIGMPIRLSLPSIPAKAQPPKSPCSRSRFWVSDFSPSPPIALARCQARAPSTKGRETSCVCARCQAAFSGFPRRVQDRRRTMSTAGARALQDAVRISEKLEVHGVAQHVVTQPVEPVPLEGVHPALGHRHAVVLGLGGPLTRRSV